MRRVFANRLVVANAAAVILMAIVFAVSRVTG